MSEKSESKLIPKLLITAVVAVAVLFILLYQIPARRFQTSLVDVYAAGHHYRIPRNYFVYPPSKNPKASKAAVLAVLWPGFEPFTKENAHLFEPGMRRKLYMTIDKEAKLVQHRHSTPLKFEEHILKEYQRRGLNNMTYVGTRSSHILVTKDKRFYLRCAFSTLPNPQCSSRINVLGTQKSFCISRVTVLMNFRRSFFRSKSF